VVRGVNHPPPPDIYPGMLSGKTGSVDHPSPK